ncbi:ATP-dependent DNA helicase [Kineobactrum sediminis]|uniref:ATP-dependent DNA helicase n=1 Tax=Kineobactrum sediminis TaxID=1905677 RepID=UPI0019D49B5A|nr:AAA family ATPase [Kineobactrum sediminis]
MSNFKFLEQFQPSLSEYGRCAENFAYADPQSAIVKMRCFAEKFVAFIYEELGLPTYGAITLFEKIDNADFVRVVEECVVDKLHLIRMKGNKAAHADKVGVEDALDVIKEGFFLGAWIFCSYHGGEVSTLPEYLAPREIGDSADDRQSIDQREAVESSLIQTQQELADLQRQLEEAQLRLNQLDGAIDVDKVESLRLGSAVAIASIDFQAEETRRKINMVDVFAEYDLTLGQAELVGRLDKFLTSTDENVFLLKGYAGTGKTFITKGLTQYFRAIRRNYILAAPTGKAAKVIAYKTGSEAHTIHKTIYSFKDIAEYRDDDLDGSETYKFYAKLAVNEQSVDTIYIVDESSMVSDIYNEAEFFRFGSGHLLRDFLKFVNLDHNDHRKKVIFIGDDAQLPPVGMNFSPALSSKYLSSEYGLNSTGYELREVVRQKAGSGIMSNAQMLRDSLEKSVFNQLDIDIDSADVYHVEYEHLLSEYLRTCGGKINAESIVIAHSNADVAAYNRRIREHFFPKMIDVAPGDKVMSVSNSGRYGLFISNGDFGLIRQVLGGREERQISLKRKSKETGEIENTQITLCFRDVEIGFKDLDGRPHWFEAKIVENLLYSDDPNLSSDENKALYLDFCIRNQGLKRKSLEFKEKLQCDPYFNALRLKFGYAITCHKAQGSEWNNVFVKCKTHQAQLSAEYFRWLYTAMTRAAKCLYVLDPPHIKIGGNIRSTASPGDLGSNSVTKKTIPEPASTSSNSKADSHEDHCDGDVMIEAGLRSGNKFLDAILGLVQSKICNSNIVISEIQHQQFQESYIFSKGAEVARINISYNGKRKITFVKLPQPSDLGGHLFDVLSPLQGVIPTLDDDQMASREIIFAEDFLNAFHQRVLGAMESIGVEVSGVEEQQYCQRYKFRDETGLAVVDIYYNGKKQFAHCNPVKSLSTSQVLTGQMMQVITEGLV